MASVTKMHVTDKGDPKGGWLLELGFPDCVFFMPSAVMGQVNKDMFVLSIIPRIKCMCLKGLLLVYVGIGRRRRKIRQWH